MRTPSPARAVLVGLCVAMPSCVSPPSGPTAEHAVADVRLALDVAPTSRERFTALTENQQHRAIEAAWNVARIELPDTVYAELGRCAVALATDGWPHQPAIDELCARVLGFAGLDAMQTEHHVYGQGDGTLVLRDEYAMLPLDVIARDDLPDLRYAMSLLVETVFVPREP